MSNPGPEIQTLRQMHERELAANLMARGMRPGTVGGLVSDMIKRPELNRLWRQIHHREAPPGRPPNSVANVICTPKEAAIASAMLIEYLVFARRPDEVIDAPALCTARDQFVERVRWAGSAIIDKFANMENFWLLARDYRAGSVKLRACDRCHASYLLCNDKWTTPKFMQCPHCWLSHQ